jgi:hypothetical protein
MEAVSDPVHAGIDLVSGVTRAMRDAVAEFARVMSDRCAQLARIVADGRRGRPPRGNVRLAGQNRCGYGE